ncbi:peptidoglycan DD-metalloendopeptidase family protein [Desulfofundulus salinus]|uniref:M23 family metallopeptidase n=1 Tax=Desulfofundulus salinus TaxID=2419843 RepID=A0A494WR16_9FIRM|nr:M23 family metallopeptidase [Desulfofundulus salinum]RKO65608.1 M23 family metallopeptidase [Desulfofundulus salinum]
MGKLVKKRLHKLTILLVTGAVLAVCLLPGREPLFAAPDEAILTGVSYGNLPRVETGPPPGDRHVYRVRPGDTLEDIAGRFGLPVTALQEANGIRDANLIVEGQVLQIPAGVLTHTVLPGETLSDIARRYQVPVSRLVAVNDLPNPDTLFPGQQVTIPARYGGNLTAEAIMAALPVDQLAWPVVGWVSSPFGWRDGRPHEGVDIAAGEGEPIRAVRSGRVTFAGPRGTYGNTVIIDHGDGLETLYAHALQVLVEPGQWVDAGEIIALVGSTGRSTGPHLHLEVRLNGIPYDPLLCLTRTRV